MEAMTRPPLPGGLARRRNGGVFHVQDATGQSVAWFHFHEPPLLKGTTVRCSASRE
jgi:hypothetical protein